MSDHTECRGDAYSDIQYTRESRNNGSPRTLKRQRGGKKGAITRRIKLINELITTRGSRTKLHSHVEQLRLTLNDASTLHEELMKLTDANDEEYSNEYIELLKIDVDTCIGDVREYLRERMGDPPSRAMSEVMPEAHRGMEDNISATICDERTQRWCEEQGILGASAGALDMGKLSSQLQSFTLQDYDQGIVNPDNKVVCQNGDWDTYINTGSEPFQPHCGRVTFDTHQSYCTPTSLQLSTVISSEISNVLEPVISSFNPGTCTPYGMYTVGTNYMPGQRTSANTIPQSRQGVSNLHAVNVSQQYHPAARSRTSTRTMPTYTLQGIGRTAPTSYQPTSYQPTSYQPTSYQPTSYQPTSYQHTPYQPTSHQHAPHRHTLHQHALHQPMSNSLRPLTVSSGVDRWIDELPENEYEYVRQIEGNAAATNMMERWMVNQNLPKMEIPKFEGLPIHWVEFITHFKEIVHLQPYLSSARRMAYLQQHLVKEAKRAVNGFKGDWLGYTGALKRLKFMFGQRAGVAHAHISKVTKGKPIKESDMTALTEFFYDISDCLSNLQRLGYYSDLESTDVLRQAVARLPHRLRNKWCEKSYSIRRTQEPNLYHLEQWLETKIMAARDPYMPQDNTNGTEARSSNNTLTAFSTEVDSEKPSTHKGSNKFFCVICKTEGHTISKCKFYNEKDSEARFKVVKDRRLCFNCLKPDHTTRQCGSRFNCFIPGCKKSHHTSLHEYYQIQTPVPNPKQTSSNKLSVANLATNEAGEPDIAVSLDTNEAGEHVVTTNGTATHTVSHENSILNVTHTSTTKSRRIYFKTVPVKIISEDGIVTETYAFLDDGSEGTFIRKDLADLLKIKGHNHNVKIGTIVDEKGESIHTKKTTFTISGLHTNAKKYIIKDALVLPHDKFHTKPQYLPPDFKTNPAYKHLQIFNFKNITKDDIQLLIGTDHFETSLVSEMRQGTDTDCPVAIKTPLGWTLFGRAEFFSHNDLYETTVKVSHVRTDELSQLNEDVHKFWTTESFGTEFNVAKKYSVQDKIIEREWDITTKLENGHYIVSMPWKGSSEKLPNNRQMAEKRFRSLVNRFKRNPELHQMYRRNIHEYIEKGYARKMLLDDVNKSSSKTWYLAHHPVINIHKPNKVRTVFDAAATFKYVSLNEQLHTGPDLVNSLVGILLRFRNHPIAVTADIESMFHQVNVAEEDRDALRFLWNDDIEDTSSPDVYQMLVHIFGAKSSPSCTAYALRRTALDSSTEFPVESINAILHEFYVDDFLKSLCSVQEAIRIALDVIKILERHGFNLTKFMSNSPEVLAALPKSKLAHRKEYFELEEAPLERTLGVIWNVKLDTFTFTVDYKERPSTKRGILQTVSTVFDPPGFVTPFTVRAKILLQNLWRKRYDWDDMIDDDEKEVWLKWLSELQSLPLFEIQRCYLCPDNNSGLKTIQLHIFVDASELAFGAVGYIRTVYCNGTIWCCMLFSKSRLAPIKTLTIPRLELQAAVLGVRIKTKIVSEIGIEIDKVYFWSDSTITLQYINSETKRFKTFVANRVAEIREHSLPKQWNHIKGDDNPADAMTRGLTILQITENSQWIRGPGFLSQNEEDWPTQGTLDELNVDNVEVRTVTTTSLTEKHIEGLKKYSWSKLLNIVGWILRFINHCRHNVRSSYNYLVLKDLQDARIAVFRSIQKEHYYEQLQQLRKGDRLSAGSPLLPLNAYLDKADGLIRVGGRIKKAPIPYTAKHQIILPSKSILVNRLVYHEHKMNIDCGPNQLLGHLQDNYWIIGGRKLIKSIQRNCMECRRRTSKPKVPLMADLPKFRVDLQTPVFYNSGVDFFGPINTKIGRRTQKRWGALFTCLVTRAIHLEVAEALSTDAFINVLERFINRRGNPKQILSDCGTNFKGADKELTSCLKNLEQDKLVGFASRKSIKWVFNPPEAPHMGGVWERLVRSVKTPLYTILKDRTLTDLQLSTVFTEVESLINSRPLTAVSENPDDLEALTPNHFLLGRKGPNLPFNLVHDNDSCSRKRWKEVQFVTLQFWRRWVKEYLPKITLRPKWKTESRNMRKGDIVMIVDTNLPRGFWKLGRVVDILPGDDDRVRVVKVKTQEGTYTRPVSKLCLLEEDQMASKDINES